MPKGGKREGAGAKPRAGSPSRQHQIRFTDKEWDEIVIRAYIKGITPSEYIRLKALA